MVLPRGDVEKAVREVLIEQLGLGPDARVEPGTDFFRDLGGDSLDYAEATMDLEDRLGVQIPDTHQPSRVGDIVDMLVRYIEESDVALARGSATRPAAR